MARGPPVPSRLMGGAASSEVELPAAEAVCPEPPFPFAEEEVSSGSDEQAPKTNNKIGVMSEVGVFIPGLEALGGCLSRIFVPDSYDFFSFFQPCHGHVWSLKV